MSNAEHGTATILTTTQEQAEARMVRDAILANIAEGRLGRMTKAQAKCNLAWAEEILRRPVRG